MSYTIEGSTGTWEIVCGLEVHAQVVSQAKLFSGAATAFGSAANTQVSPVDAGMPGDAEAQYYEVGDTAGHRLTPGQDVHVRVAQPGSGAPHKVIPYSAVFYDAQGNTWAYTNQEPLVFVRQPVDVEHIEGDVAVLKEGSTLSDEVVTAGAAELWGVESEFGGGH